MSDIMKKSMVIYLLTDNTNGKKYVGKTMTTLKRRMDLHKYSQKTYVDRAIQKHGWENFTVEVLEECKTADELSEREQYWIAFHNCKDPNGYNLTDGGEGAPGRKATYESRANMSAAHDKYHIVCVETGTVFYSVREAADWAGVKKAAIHRACNGISRTAGGYHWYYQEAPHLADHEVKVVERKDKRAVRNVDTGEVFDSVTEAAKWAGVHTTVIIRVCQKVKHTAGGYSWEYAGEPSPHTKHHYKSAVICVETGEKFESAEAAAQWAGVKKKCIIRVCNGGRETTGGYHWRYADAD